MVTTNIPHPAKFTSRLEPHLTARGLVLDPFAGTGRIGRVVDGIAVGVELEIEWAVQGKDNGALMVVGNSMNLPFDDEIFDAIVTSPTYGNRMADHHNAKDGSPRRSYKHLLGHELTKGNTGQMQGGQGYRDIHISIYKECLRVLKQGAPFVLNISDHIRAGIVIPVSQWHTDALMSLGFVFVSNVDVETPRLRFGANRKRVPHEHVRVFSRPLESSRKKV